MRRRTLLMIGAAAAGGGALARGGEPPPPHPAGGHAGHAGHAMGAGARSRLLPAGTPFTQRMPVPPELRPVTSTEDLDVYRLTVRPAHTEILPGLTTPVLSYGGHFIGPTIRARAGRQVKITYRNALDRPANVHLHGGHVPAGSDGHPMDLIQPGAERLYDYPNSQQGATLWYHDHTHGTEAEHVYRGLHGFYLIDDESERPLRLPGGQYDVPILIRDAQFDDSGALVFGDLAARTTVLVNGKVQPYFPVAARKYRFRLLNAANERALRLSIGGGEMVQIASDGGLLPAPVHRDNVVISSGERVEIVVDFSRHRVGTKLILRDENAGGILRFDVVQDAPDLSRVPDRLRPLPALPAAAAERELTFSFDLPDGVPVGLINGRPYDPARDDFTVKRGSTEIWKITNGDTAFGVDHNFHMHLAQFRVLDRDGGPPTPDDAGRKDTVFIAPGTSVRVQATFTDYVGRYVYHCHFLEHSSLGMMAQMEIVP